MNEKDFSQITCFKERKSMAVGKNLRVMINIYKKLCFSVITWNEKTLLKQAVPIKYTLENFFFLLLLFLLLFYFASFEGL